MCVFFYNVVNVIFLIHLNFVLLNAFSSVSFATFESLRSLDVFNGSACHFLLAKKRMQCDGVNELEPELELLVSAVAKELYVCVCLFVCLYLNDLKKVSRRHNHDSVDENIQRAYR